MTAQDLTPGAPAQSRWPQLPTAVTGISGGMSAAGLLAAGAPVWIVALLCVITIVVMGIIWLVITVIPQESGHRLDWWREILGYLERKRTAPTGPAVRHSHIAGRVPPSQRHRSASRTVRLRARR